eukprot:m.351747 g.351747  ORF g.351747 m.351747 type:complete len:56 (-) comp16337_c0_seq1:1131-1298(-)
MFIESNITEKVKMLKPRNSNHQNNDWNNERIIFVTLNESESTGKYTLHGEQSAHK